jgi:AcrR family transcriptional regulator
MTTTSEPGEAAGERIVEAAGERIVEAAGERIVAAARRVLADDPTLPMAAVATAAGVSRATLHRHFRTRAELLAAAGVEPDVGTRQRVLAAAAELVARDGLEGLSMDEVAAAAEVSRASVYRLFPGKPALFEALLLTRSPFEPVIALLGQVGDRPPGEVVPAIHRMVASIAAANLGLLRAVYVEVWSGSPDAVAGAGRPLRAMIRSVGGYLERQMALGRLERMDPVLAVQCVLGPLVFHLLTRPVAKQIAGLDIPLEDVVEQLGAAALRSLQPTTPGPGVANQE